MVTFVLCLKKNIKKGYCMGRKKLEPIVSLGRDEDKLLVQKSNSLFALWQSDLTLAEFKILDTYLSRIDSHKPEKRAVVFEKGELEQLLGVLKINNVELEKRLMHLMGNVVKVSDMDDRKGFRLVTLFEEAVADQDDYGLWQVKLECTQKAMKYFFNIDNLGYLRYKLRCITSISSRYTYILFVYLESNRYRKSWKVDLEELKNILSCNKEELYKEFKRFNDKILKRVQKEMHKKTECKFSYEPIKKGRSVVAIQFTLETLSKLVETDSKQITIEDYGMNSSDSANLWESALCKTNNSCEFSRSELDEIFQILVTIPNHKMPHSSACFDNIELQRYHYMIQQFAVLNRKDTKNKPIKNRFAYFIKMLKTDTKI